MVRRVHHDHNMDCTPTVVSIEISELTPAAFFVRASSLPSPQLRREAHAYDVRLAEHGQALAALRTQQAAAVADAARVRQALTEAIVLASQGPPSSLLR